jgi:tRNA 2-thiouridine synthesizing protein E
MITIRVAMKFSDEPLKRTPVVLRMDADDRAVGPVLTDRAGTATFDVPPGSGIVEVSGVERFHGRLDGEIRVDLWSITQAPDDWRGTPGALPAGSNAYPGMQTETVVVDGREVLVDSEGYLVDPADWSEAFARAEAEREGIGLAAEHWEVIRYLRDHYIAHGRQATVRDMIRHFRRLWDAQRGSNRYLHKLFPARWAPEAGQPACRPAAYQGRALIDW